MSTQSSAPPDAEIQRRRHLDAMAAAESVIRTSPVLPVTVSVTCLDPAHPRVSVQHESAAGVEALAHVLGESTTTTPFRRDDPRPFVSVSFGIDEVPVQAWALLDVPADAVGTGGAA
ncbi:hypothetical protein ACFU99_16745 [Streptomyces sp. NPDC057654]|uniref:hypothetical protein n=1 Tax=Streptomyces sp. NPDC057654 TaxID=3346196 RepID=UPI00369F3073